MTHAELLQRLDAKPNGVGHKAKCPAHDDRNPSLSIGKGDDGRSLVYCHAGCTADDIAGALGVQLSDFYPEKPQRLPERRLTLSELAEHKKLPVGELRALGLHDLPAGGVGIPYRDPEGRDVLVKRRVALIAKEGSIWPKGQPLMPYGLDRLADARELERLFIVEGESDCWTLWHHGMPALGVPGASSTSCLPVELLQGIKSIYVVDERDKGAAAFVPAVCTLLPQAKVIRFDDAKDPSELHQRDPLKFIERLERAIASSATTSPFGLVELCDGITEATIAAKQNPITTGLAVLDEELGGGLFPGEVTVFQATTGQGKTTINLAIQCDGVAGDPERSGLYVSTEMGVEELQARRACQVLNNRDVRVNWRDVMRGKPSLTEIREVTSGTKIHVLKVRPSADVVERVRVAAIALRERYGKPPVIVTDYLQAMSLGLPDQERRAAVGTMIYDLQAIATELYTPVIVISSVGRSGSTRDKRESDDPYDFVNLAKEAGEIEYAGANVLHLDVKADEDPDGWREARIVIAKSRFGRLGIVGLRFHGASGRFQGDPRAALTEYDREILKVIAGGVFPSANSVAKKVGKNEPKVKRSVAKLLRIGLVRNLGGTLSEVKP